MHSQHRNVSGSTHQLPLDTMPLVFVVDDDISIRESIAALLGFEGWQTETFATAQAFLDRALPFGPSCLVLDVSLPDLNGLDLQAMIADRVDMPIVFITGHGDIPMSVRAMKAGAVEFLTKPINDDMLLLAVRQAMEHSVSTRAKARDMNTLQRRHALLSKREREVMALVVTGLLNKQVAAQLQISEITVKAHRGQAMRKMEAHSLADLVMMAAQLRQLHMAH